MAWFWDAYAPDIETRNQSYASPLRAADQQLAGLPPALVIVDEADVLRDEGEAYAARLRAAGVAVTTVRYDGITHDFMMLNPLSGTRATRAAVAQASSACASAARHLTPVRFAPRARWARHASASHVHGAPSRTASSSAQHVLAAALRRRHAVLADGRHGCPARRDVRLAPDRPTIA